MIVTSVTAVKYKGAGRYYLSKRAAYRSWAKLKYWERHGDEGPDDEERQIRSRWSGTPEYAQWLEDQNKLWLARVVRAEAVIARLARFYAHLDRVKGRSHD